MFPIPLDKPVPANALIAITFSKSRSPYFDEAVILAQSFKFYSHHEGLHVVVVQHDRSDMLRAVRLLKYCMSWNSTQTFAGKQMQTPFYVNNTLMCYLDSMASGSTEKHCNSQGLPCKLIAGVNGSKPDDIESMKVASVLMRCNWCPQLDYGRADPKWEEKQQKVKYWR